MATPITTHQWLRNLYLFFTGRGTNQPMQLGSPTQAMGFYGFTGLPRSPTSIYRSTGGFTGGASGAAVDSELANGGTGTYYSRSDVIRALKNIGILPQ